ncbi:hypothetical protein BJ165DRAFT_1530977 [Panaeolus papilionaceus]|nr:hypothetical protein BJ165DRAFT_1530977 [Panaeolus papilionaceus]
MMESESAPDVDVEHNKLLALLNNAPWTLPSPNNEDVLLQVLNAAPAYLPPTQDDEELLELLKTALPELPPAELDNIMYVLQNAPMEIVVEDATDDLPTTAEFQDLMDLLGMALRDVLPASEDQSPDLNVGLTAEQDLLHLLATAPSQLSEPPRNAGLSLLGGTDSGDIDIFSVLRNAPAQIPLSPEPLSVDQPSSIDNSLWTMRSGDVMHSNGGSSGYVSDGASSDDSENDGNEDSDPADSEAATLDEADEDNEESEDDNEEDEDNEDEDEDDDEEEVVSGLFRRGSSSSMGGMQYGSDDQLYVSSN